MQTQFTVQVNKAQRAWDVDVSKLPEHVQSHILSYGVRQILNDAAASAKTKAEAEAMVQKRFENLTSGTLRASVGRASDPVSAEAKKIATKLVDDAIRAKGKKPSEVSNRAELIAKHSATDKVLAQAKANVSAASKLEIEIDL